MFDTSRGWGAYGKASRVSELERELSKHLVLRLTNAFTHIDVAVVHLRVPRNGDGDEKQKDQNRALLRWAMRHLAKNPKANLIIMGDFNEGMLVGSPEQNLAVLFQSQPPMIDVFDHFKGKPVTHSSGIALDRILISDGLFRGSSDLKFSGVQVQRHCKDRGVAKRLYTDHYPVSVKLSYRN
jgi:endonuclease/exonuclease/phosphatase family metal-dependent hydrolase